MEPTPTPPELTDAQKLALMKAMQAADKAAAGMDLRAIADAIVQILAERQTVSQEAIAKANALIASLNVHAGWQLDPLTGVFGPKSQEPT